MRLFSSSNSESARALAPIALAALLVACAHGKPISDAIRPSSLRPPACQPPSSGVLEQSTRLLAHNPSLRSFSYNGYEIALNEVGDNSSDPRFSNGWVRVAVISRADKKIEFVKLAAGESSVFPGFKFALTIESLDTASGSATIRVYDCLK